MAENENENETGLFELNNNAGEENAEFKPESFLLDDEESDSSGSDNKNENQEENQEENNNSSSDESEDDAMLFNLDDAEEEEVDGSGQNNNNDSSNEENNSENNDTNQSGSSGDDIIKEFEKIGIKAKDKDDVFAQIKKLQDENLSLKTGSVKSEKIDKYKSFLSLSDKELVKKDYEAQGFKGDKLDKVLKNLEDNDMLDIEAMKIRNSIKGAINREVAFENQKSEETVAKQKARQEAVQKELMEHIGKTKTMFGFKMVKNDADLPKAHKKLQDYILSGKFYQDTYKDANALTEAAYFQMHKDNIMKALKNKGAQQAKRELLGDMGSHSADDTIRIPNPHGNDEKEFNPKSFIAD